MKRYIPLFPIKEKRLAAFKAWYNPNSNYFNQFSTNGLHSEVAEQELRMSEDEAIRKGYYRIYMDISFNVNSYTKPDDREFSALQYLIKKHGYANKIIASYWDTEKDGVYMFPKQSFLYADSIEDGERG